MTVALIAAALLAGAAAATAATVWWSSHRGLLASRARRQVIVTLKTGEAFSGLLYAADRDAVVLRDTTALSFGHDGGHLPVEGEAVLLRSDIAYMQVP